MVRTLQLDLGEIDGFDPLIPELAPGQVLATGWYVDQTTGQWYYYDALISQWYFYAAGYLWPLAWIPPTLVWQSSPSPKVECNLYDTIHLSLSYKYRGPKDKSFTLYAAVCNNTKSGEPAEWSGFAESKGIYPPESATWRTITDSIDIVMGKALMPTHSGEDGAVYFKIENYRSPAYWDAIHMIEAKGEFQELKITSIAKV